MVTLYIVNVFRDSKKDMDRITGLTKMIYKYYLKNYATSRN